MNPHQLGKMDDCPFCEGRKAALAGEPDTDNPHARRERMGPTDLPVREQWAMGYQAGIYEREDSQ
jgi:hypothetical protein